MHHPSLSSLLTRILCEPLSNDIKPSFSPEAWETQFFVNLENQEESPLMSLTDDSKTRLELVFQFAQKYLAFHYRYRRRLSGSSALNLLDTSELIWTKVDDEHRHSPIEWIGFVPLYQNGNLGTLNVIHYGTSNRVQVEPMELFARVLSLRPLGFYLIHNHPSGDLNPSWFDHQLTERVKNASEAIGLKFFGHGVVSSIGETWIYDISQVDDPHTHRKFSPRTHSSASTRARQSSRHSHSNDDVPQKLSASSGTFDGKS